MQTSKKMIWIGLGIFLASVLTFAGGIGYRMAGQPASAEQLYFPPASELTPRDKPVIGNLGGLPVTFPPNFAELVEYDGDPGFGERRIKPRPARTHQSRIRGMGFDMKYPDFTVMQKKEREADKRKYTIHNTPWIGVSITASEDFGDGRGLERRFVDMRNDMRLKYKRIPEDLFGLENYTPTVVDVSKRYLNQETKTYPIDSGDEDVFVHRDEGGEIDAFITCSNVQHRAAPCTHIFYLGLPLKTQMRLAYRRGMLEHWREIQSEAKKIVFSFKI